MRTTSNSMDSASLEQHFSIGDKFISFLLTCPEDSPKIESTISYLTQPTYLTNFASPKFVKSVAELIEMYPKRQEITKKIVEKLVNFPIIHLIVTALKKLDKGFLTIFDDETKSKLTKALQNSSKEEVLKQISDLSFPVIKFEHKGKFVSISDVYNESCAEVLDFNSSKALQCVEQFNPITEKDVSDFVINLVSSKSPISKAVAEKYQERNTLLSLLRPFKGTKVTIDELIKSFDSGSIIIQTVSSFSVFILAIKEVTNSRVVSAAPFLTRWEHPKTQLNFIQHIITINPTPVQFPKPSQQKINNLLVAEFKGDHWRHLDFIKALAFLYEDLPDEINNLLNKISPTNSTALLLIVLAQSGESSSFAGQLLGNLVTCPQQYMPGISLLWAINKDFLVQTTARLYSDKPTMLGRCFDIIDDLGVYEEFKEKSPADFRTVLEIFAFFRNGNDFRPYLKTLNNIDFIFQIFERPSDFGFLVPMGLERNLRDTNQITAPSTPPPQQTNQSNQQPLPFKLNDSIKVSADFLFFSYLDEIYPQFDEKNIKTIKGLFQKCCERTKKLSQFEFHWHQKVSAPASPKPSRDLDLPSMAMKTEKEATQRFKSHVQQLVSDFPKDIVNARKSGENLGVLLSRNLLGCDESLAAMNIITRGLQQRENTPGFEFSKEAVRAMAPGFELCKPFAREVVMNQQIKKIMPEIHAQAVSAIMPPPFIVPYEEPITPTQFRLHPKLLRFEHIYPNNERDKNALGTILKEFKTPGASTPPQNHEFNQVCIEAAIYLIYHYINKETENSIWKLTRIAKWLASQTLAQKNPSFGRYLNIPDLITYGYENNKLSSILPFLTVLFKDIPSVFYLPCPWSVSILSVLAGIYRLPFLRKSLVLMISSIFNSFHCEIYEVEPKRLRPLDHLPTTDRDFLFPPINFEISVVSREALYAGDIVSIAAVVSRFFKGADNQTTREVALFVHSKVPAIAKSAYETAFALSTKDFSHSKDSDAAEKYAKSLIRSLCKSLASTAVKLEFTYILPRSTRLIESLVSNLAQHVAYHLLTSSMNPLRRLREVSDGPFLDVQAFPPSVASIVPEELWPHSSNAIKNGEGIYGCYNVPSNLKRVYSKFSSLALDMQISQDIPFDLGFAQQIYPTFTYNSAGEPIGYMPTKAFNFSDSNLINIIGTIITCFPVQRISSVVQCGVDALQQLTLFTGEFKPQYSPEVENMVSQKMPHMRIFVALINFKMIRLEKIEPLFIGFVDEHGLDDVDISPMIEWLHTNLHEINISLFQRVFEVLLSTQTIQPKSKLDELISAYMLCEIRDREQPLLKPSSVGAVFPPNFLNEFQKKHIRQDYLTEFIKPKMGILLEDKTWTYLITKCYPNHKTELLQILFAVMYYHISENHQIDILSIFLRQLYNTYVFSGNIDAHFFSSVLATTIIHLRNRSNIASTFGGFLFDIRPVKIPILTSVWMYLLPLVIPPLLQYTNFWAALSHLIGYVLERFSKFPANWGDLPHFRKFYKSLLKLILLIIHDSPKYVAQYCFDFVSNIPLKFRRLRNIILSTNCNDINDISNHSHELDLQILKGADTFPNFISNLKEKTFSKFELIFIDIWCRTKSDYHVWVFARGFLLAVDNSEDATLIIEALFDCLRARTKQTADFENVICKLYNELDVTYNQMTIKEIIIAVLNARYDNLPPIPYGLTSLNEKINK